MAKKENTIPTIIDTPEALTAKIAAMKEAQKIFATFTQEQVDKIFKEIKDYYQYLKAIDAYPAYRDGINTGYASCVTDIKNIHEWVL